MIRPDYNTQPPSTISFDRSLTTYPLSHTITVVDQKALCTSMDYPSMDLVPGIPACLESCKATRPLSVLSQQVTTKNIAPASEPIDETFDVRNLHNMHKD